MTRIPLPPLPTLDALTHTTNHVLASITPGLRAPRTPIALYDDSPYIAPVADPEPDEDNGPWCSAPRP